MSDQSSHPSFEESPLRWLLGCVWRYIDEYGFRMTVAEGQLSDLYVSITEVEKVLGGRPSGGEAARLQLAPLEKGFELVGIDPARMHHLRSAFDLEQRDMELLVAAAAPAISVDLARLYAFAWADFTRKTPSVGFLAELTASDPRRALGAVSSFYAHAPLVRHRLVVLSDNSAVGKNSPLLHKDVTVPESVVAFLRGDEAALPWSFNRAGRIEPAAPAGVPTWVPEDTRRLAAAALHSTNGVPKPVLLIGADGSGRRKLARAYVGAREGLFIVELAALAQKGDQFADLLVASAREARLRNHVLLLHGDGFFEDMDDTPAHPHALRAVIEMHTGQIILTAREKVRFMSREIDGLVEIEVPLPSEATQRGLWDARLRAAEVDFPVDLPSQLSLRFNTSPGTIAHAVRDAQTQARLQSHNGSPPKVMLVDIAEAMRRRINHALGEVASIYTTTLGWENVVLPTETRELIEEIRDQARFRTQVLKEWGFRQLAGTSRGLACLFAGPPGTGKTMMAGILARDLGQELYRIDLSRVVSKWVGETEKNLSRVFDEAEKAQVILLFDEADSLFAKRTEVKASQDRFANMEVNYLLQRMETYDGMSILTTNMASSLDEALKRRLRFKVHFTLPDIDDRTEMWEKMIPAGMPRAPDIRFDRLAARYKVSGGLIRNAVLRAAYLAARDSAEMMTEAHLQEALRRDLIQAGRL